MKLISNTMGSLNQHIGNAVRPDRGKFKKVASRSEMYVLQLEGTSIYRPNLCFIRVPLNTMGLEAEAAIGFAGPGTSWNCSAMVNVEQNVIELGNLTCTD